MARGLYSSMQGNWDHAWSEVSAVQRALESRDPSGLRGWSAAVSADIAVMAGRWSDAERLLEIADSDYTRASRGLEPFVPIHACRGGRAGAARCGPRDHRSGPVGD